MLFLPSIPKTSIPAFLDAADVLFVELKRSPLYRFGIALNKLMDYMMAGKPIIQAGEVANDLVADCHCGLSIPPEDPGAIAAAVLQMMRMTPAEREAMGRRGHEYVSSRHEYRVLAQEFLDAMK